MLPTRFAAVALGLLGVVWSAGARAQEAPGSEDGPMVHAPIVRQAPAAKEVEVPAAAQETPVPMEPVVVYNKAIFQRLIPAAELTFLQQSVGGASGDLYRDREFRHVVRGEVPGWMFHYGRDMPVQEALDAALEGSRVPGAGARGAVLPAKRAGEFVCRVAGARVCLGWMRRMGLCWRGSTFTRRMGSRRRR